MVDAMAKINTQTQADGLLLRRPEGSETYRVIYGDLSVQDVALENLPKASE